MLERYINLSFLNIKLLSLNSPKNYLLLNIIIRKILISRWVVVFWLMLRLRPPSLRPLALPPTLREFLVLRLPSSSLSLTKQSIVSLGLFSRLPVMMATSLRLKDGITCMPSLRLSFFLDLHPPRSLSRRRR